MATSLHCKHVTAQLKQLFTTQQYADVTVKIIEPPREDSTAATTTTAGMSTPTTPSMMTATAVKRQKLTTETTAAATPIATEATAAATSVATETTTAATSVATETTTMGTSATSATVITMRVHRIILCINSPYFEGFDMRTDTIEVKVKPDEAAVVECLIKSFYDKTVVAELAIPELVSLLESALVYGSEDLVEEICHLLETKQPDFATANSALERLYAIDRNPGIYLCLKL